MTFASRGRFRKTASRKKLNSTAPTMALIAPKTSGAYMPPRAEGSSGKMLPPGTSVLVDLPTGDVVRRR
jgi:hypothetical protein